MQTKYLLEIDYESADKLFLTVLDDTIHLLMLNEPNNKKLIKALHRTRAYFSVPESYYGGKYDLF